jgi:hypothetical protein
MFRRRSFLIGCGGLAAAPVFAGSGSPLSPAPQPPMLAAAALPVGAEIFTLRIAGWDMAGRPQPPADGEMWVQVSSTWQAAWR